MIKDKEGYWSLIFSNQEILLGLWNGNLNHMMNTDVWEDWNLNSICSYFVFFKEKTCSAPSRFWGTGWGSECEMCFLGEDQAEAARRGRGSDGWCGESQLPGCRARQEAEELWQGVGSAPCWPNAMMWGTPCGHGWRRWVPVLPRPTSGITWAESLSFTEL